MRPRTRALAVAALAVACLAPSASRADAASEARLRDALRAATIQVRALEDEKAAWQASEAALRRELESLRKRPAPADGGDRKAAERERRIAEQAASIAQLKATLEACQASSRSQAEAAEGLERERARLAAEATVLQARLAAGEARNAAMYQVAREVLDWIDALGPGEAYEAREPFLGLKRVELENVSQDLRDRLLEKKVSR
jgi:chromosome segregation ATPase